jgi:hypothetical protein
LSAPLPTSIRGASGLFATDAPSEASMRSMRSA